MAVKTTLSEIAHAPFMRYSEITNTVEHEGSIIMPRRKYSIAQQISAAKACITGEASIMEIARRFGVSRTGLKEWAARYEAGGETAFEITGKNHAYQGKTIKSSNCKRSSGNSGSLRDPTKGFEWLCDPGKRKQRK